MLSADTNILLYAISESSPYHKKARSYLTSLENNTEVVIAELVLVELYIALRNPILFSSPLNAKEAVEFCSSFRNHPRWQLVENAKVMDAVWQEAFQPHFVRRHIFDLRLAKTLQPKNVNENEKDFVRSLFQNAF